MAAIDPANAYPGPTLTRPVSEPVDKAILEAARKLEATFLAEMLKAAKLGETPEEFGGGIGEDQFASFLRQAQAETMVEAGGIGLAEQIYRSMVKEA